MKIKSIKEVKPRTVYAVKTTSNTFIADGLAHHNCVGCNMFRSGEQYKFSLFIEDYYGKGTAEQIRKEAQEFHKFTREELEEIISDAKTQIDFYLKQG